MTTPNFISVDTSLLWTLIVRPSGVHITEVLLHPFPDMPSLLKIKKKLHTLKAQCPPSLTAWRNGVGIRWGGGMHSMVVSRSSSIKFRPKLFKVIQVGQTDGRRVMKYPP